MPLVRQNDSNEEKRQRLIEAAMAVLWEAPGHRMNIVQLNKALFYLDLLWLRDNGATATGQTYIALRNGPVVAKYPERLVGALVSSGLARQEADGQAKPVVALRQPDACRFFPARELARDVAEVFSRIPSSKLSEFSHGNPGWQLAFRTGKPSPIDMEIALQQLCDDDAWLDQPADEQLERQLQDAAKNAVDL